MTMSERPSKRELYPRVADFYDGKSVLITGAAGFVGMIILEILLRTCPGIKSIYILIREKKGVMPEQRKEKLFQKVIFNQVKEDQPDALGKVRLVAGDISKPDLGISEEDMDQIIQNVNIVFHCAADINFIKSIKYLMGVNAIGTHYMVEVCKKIKDLEALVYTSTICSNSNRSELVVEEIYRLPFASEKFLKEFREGTDESLDALIALCQPPWPNGYTFNKALAENILLENANELPIAIVRPSLVASTWKAPHPGFCEKNSSLALLTEGAGKGFIKVVLLDKDNHLDFVPVDVVANCHIVAAWRIATERSKAPYIINCSCSGLLNETWTDFKEELLKFGEKHPVPNCFRTPNKNVSMTKDLLTYRILTFYEHYVPAYVIDLFLKLSGNKLRLVRLYDLLDKAMLASSFFTLGNTKFDTTNFRALEDDLDEGDKEKFYTDISDITIKKMLEKLPEGNDSFDWKTDRLSKEERRKKSDQRQMFTQFIKYAFLIIMFTMVYFITSTVYQLVW